MKPYTGHYSKQDNDNGNGVFIGILILAVLTIIFIMEIRATYRIEALKMEHIKELEAIHDEYAMTDSLDIDALNLKIYRKYEEVLK
jgi:hypothetical protein